MKDASQIQIKYAKMLEELENDSIEDLGVTGNPENCFSRQDTDTKDYLDNHSFPMQIHTTSALSNKSPFVKGKH